MSPASEADTWENLGSRGKARLNKGGAHGDDRWTSVCSEVLKIWCAVATNERNMPVREEIYHRGGVSPGRIRCTQVWVDYVISLLSTNK